MRIINKINNLGKIINRTSFCANSNKDNNVCVGCNDSGSEFDEKMRMWPCRSCMMGTLVQVKSCDHVEYGDTDIRQLAIYLYGHFLEANNFSTNLLERDFIHFSSGDSAIEVWHWFESTFNVSAIELDRQFNEQESRMFEKESDDAVF